MISTLREAIHVFLSIVLNNYYKKTDQGERPTRNFCRSNCCCDCGSTEKKRNKEPVVTYGFRSIPFGDQRSFLDKSTKFILAPLLSQMMDVTVFENLRLSFTEISYFSSFIN
jgi:hypothetical protein